MNVLLIDYRGYGRSEGVPTIHGIYEDGKSAYRYLCSRSDIDTARIVVYGHSLGSFVAIQVALSFPAAGVILEGSISNAVDMKDALLRLGAPWYLRWLVKADADSAVYTLDNLKAVHHLTQPLLIVTGENDQLAPPGMGKKIYDSSASTLKRFEIIPNGEHDDLYFTPDVRKEKYVTVVSKFLDDVLNHKKTEK
jgi:fermentation-respiration switch protein FrsA (DUF1100 family)